MGADATNTFPPTGTCANVFALGLDLTRGVGLTGRFRPKPDVGPQKSVTTSPVKTTTTREVQTQPSHPTASSIGLIADMVRVAEFPLATLIVDNNGNFRYRR